jgi:hypothetical protein
MISNNHYVEPFFRQDTVIISNNFSFPHDASANHDLSLKIHLQSQGLCLGKHQIWLN